MTDQQKAENKARKNPGRIVYAIRDEAGKLHVWLSIHCKGHLVVMVAADREGNVVAVSG